MISTSQNLVTETLHLADGELVSRSPKICAISISGVGRGRRSP
ncbi:hypothetical protein U8P71_26100 (plasmid) [Rhizobium ruizarguesonis]|nr:hypothetical protein U8P71_26100 [Rhizobium ruizarguesonis]